MFFTRKLKVSIKSQQLSAFTLAEVLITLLIVGVVAALTIPILINSIQDRENHTKLKKVYSIFSAATQQIVSDHSGDLWDDSSSNSTVLSQSMRDEYKQYFDYIEEGLDSDLRTNEWVGYKSSASVNSPGSTRHVIYLSDGTYLYFYSRQNCTSALPYCASIIVDVNGEKGPNMVGKDVHGFYVIKTVSGEYKVRPGGSWQGQTCVKGSTVPSTSYGCTEYVINNKNLP